MVQEALDRWWGPLMQMHGPRTDPAKDRDLYWRIKAKTGEQLRQEFLSMYVPRLWEMGLYHPGSGAALGQARASGATPSPTGRSCARSSPDHGPRSQERLDFRRGAATRGYETRPGPRRGDRRRRLAAGSPPALERPIRTATA